MSEYTIPGGDEKGTLIKKASETSLTYWAERIGADLDAGKTPEKFVDYNTKLHKAILAELASRGHAQQELPQTKPAAQKEAEKQPDKVEQQSVPEQKAEMVVRSATELTGTFRDYKDITDRFAQAAKHFHFISPATSCPRLPEGCSVALSAITVDKDNDTYTTGDKLALSKSPLQKISLSAGITWDPSRSGRTDDGSHPHYCSWTSVATMRLFDGSITTLIGSKEMDLRDGSAQVQALYDRYEAAKAYKAKNPKAKEPKDPTAQIREMRLHIAAHAETKAQLRAIRSIGIKTSYPPDDLNKPFIVARLMFTGDTDSPALKEKFATMQAEAMIGAGRSMYGEAYQAPQLPKNAPPRLGTVPVDAEDMGDDY